MKKRSAFSTVLTIAAVLLCAAIIVSGIHLGITVKNGTSSASSEELEDYDLVFTGKTIILDEDYDITLKGKSGVFTMDANNLKGIMDGIYSFTEGQGWTFVFDDSLGTNARTKYNSENKSHELLYALDMGSRGSGTILLSREDDGFKASETPWDDIPIFSGTAGWFGGTLKGTVTCICNAENQFRIICETYTISSITGTYTFEDGIYTLTTDDGNVYKTTTDSETGLPTFTVTVHQPGLEAYGAADAEAQLSLVVLNAE